MNEYKKRVYQGIICVTALTLISMPAFSAEKTDKVAPLHSFFAKTEKPKTESNVTNETTKTKKASKKEKEIKTNVKDPAIKGINAIKGSVFTMENCVEYALENDPNIKNYRNTQEKKKSEVGIAKSSYFPSITGGTGYNINNTKYFGDKSNSLNNNYYGLDLSITEMIWDFGKTSAKINMSKFNYEAAGYDVENSILYRIYDVKIAYTAVLAARANVDIYARSVRINKLNVDRTKAMYEVGLKSKIDVVNADANLTEAKISLLEAQKEYEVSLIELNNSIFYVNAPSYLIQNTETFNFQKNYSVKNELNVAYDRKHYDASSVEAEMKDGAILTSGIEKQDILKTYKFKPFPYTMDEAIQLAYQNRPDLKSLILVRRASEESLKAIKRSYFPAINASGGYSLMKQSDYGTVTKIERLAGINGNSAATVTPIDSTMVYESEDGTIWLTGHAWYHNIANPANSVTYTRLQLVKTKDVDSSSNKNRNYYAWIIPADINDFGQNILTKSSPYGLTDGSEEIINTSYGPFLERTSRSIQQQKNYGNYVSEPLLKLKQVNSINEWTDYGEQIKGLTIDSDFSKIIKSVIGSRYTKLFEMPDKRLFVFSYDLSTLYLYEYDSVNNKLVKVANVNVLDENNPSGRSCPDYIKNFEVFDYNGILFFKLFNNRVYRYGDYKLSWVTTNTKASNDEVLYDLKLTIENKDKYNNLPENTENSEIDKFVIKEIGMINPQVDRDADLFRHITQFFAPHNYYNKATGLVEKVIMDPDKPETGIPKEYFRIKNLKELYKEIYKGFGCNNIIISKLNLEFILQNVQVYLMK